ncbi:hypothetical protein [Allorhodopirellula heiligendammensis]|uniref:hypothetical protein n=1 Tax=Allorhodopirellula heiligendammensis TaxID=2714739 RepID=UPI0011B56F5C|nr:hypothetical protein [Allorhodopirellula heiligendammensis]
MSNSDFWNTPIYKRHTENDGPTVLIIAGVRGDQPEGVLAADAIRHWPIQRGQLIVVPCVNWPAIMAGTATTPGEPQTTYDLGTAYPSQPKQHEARTPLGRSLWAFAQNLRPDLIIDLQSSVDDFGNGKYGTAILYQGDPSTAALAEAGRKKVDQSGCIGRPQAVTLNRPMPDGSFVAAMNHKHQTPVIIVKAYQSQSGTTRSRNARQQRHVVHGVLEHLKMLNETVHPDQLLPPRQANDNSLRIGVFTGPGAVSSTGHGPYWLMRSWQDLEDHRFVPIAGEEARSNAIRQFDVLYFGGGTSTEQGKSLGEIGRENVKRFIHDGGGYVGACAGFFLLMPLRSTSLQIIQAENVHERSSFGKAEVNVELTPLGKVLLGPSASSPNQAVTSDSAYSNGPVVKPSPDRGEVAYQPLAFYRTETTRYNSQAGLMINTPSSIYAEYGRGRIIAHSCHPERPPGPQQWFRRSFTSVAPPAYRQGSRESTKPQRPYGLPTGCEL